MDDLGDDDAEDVTEDDDSSAAPESAATQVPDSCSWPMETEDQDDAQWQDACL